MNKTITPNELQKLTEYVKRAAGIELGPTKQYLVESRLGPLLERYNCKTYADMIALADTQRSVSVREALIDAITTNETLWFRDTRPYDALTKFIVPEVLKESTAKVRIWSAAASTGQEAYSISMALSELAAKNSALRSAGYEILATDISAQAIRSAKAGVYEETAMSRGLSEERKRAYFTEVQGGWKVKAHVQASVTFREANLLTGLDTTPFDIVFLRNVLIYFSPETKRDILAKIARLTRPGGFVLVGATENLGDLCSALTPSWFERTMIYRKGTTA